MRPWTTTLLLALGIQVRANDLHGWKQVGRAPADTEIDLHIALKPALSWKEIEQIAVDIASPSHYNFRKHLSRTEVSALADPSHESQQAVEEWLQQYGISGRVRGGILEAYTAVSTAEKLLGAQYFRYEKDGVAILRTPEYSIPGDVLEHIEFVTPTSQFPFRSEKPTTETLPQKPLTIAKRASCGSDDQVTPICVKQVYNITYTPKANRTSFAVYGTEAASFVPSDLESYLSNFNAPAASANATYQVIGSGDTDEADGGIEASFETALGTQTMLGIAWPAQGIFYNLGGLFGPNGTRGKTYDPLVTFLQGLVNNDTVPSVVSFSESIPEDQMDPAYARRLCSMMAQIGARGVSLLFSSGNNGPNGDVPTGRHENIFEPEFPATCPYVTGVGGTTDLADEVGATNSSLASAGIGGSGYWASGGGFSNLFARPDYQEDVVGSYIDNSVPSNYSSASGFNASGRGVPDVAAFSSNIPVTVGSITIGIGGTSASAPIWAAVVTILNDYLASQGQPPLGFLNPWLYGLSSGLKDITGGGNSVGQCNDGCDLSEVLGYEVTKGWDAVTGLGSPNVGLLIEALRTNSSSTPPGSTPSGTPTGSATSSSVPSSTEEPSSSPSSLSSRHTTAMSSLALLGCSLLFALLLS